MKYLDIVDTVSKELNIPSEVVKSAYKSYWEFIRKEIESFPLKGDLNEEEFKKLRTNFNIPSLGKLTLTYDRYIRMKKKVEHIKNIQNAKNK